MTSGNSTASHVHVFQALDTTVMTTLPWTLVYVKKLNILKLILCFYLFLFPNSQLPFSFFLKKN